MRQLKLIPLMSGYGLEVMQVEEGVIIPFNILSFNPDSRINEQIGTRKSISGQNVVKVKPIPKKVFLAKYTDTGIVDTHIDGNGEILTYTTAGELKQLHIPDDSWFPNDAIMAYIDHLPDDCLVVIDWE